jgi:hypothetical protein
MFPNPDDENLDEETREYLKSVPDNKVFEWLGMDSQGLPMYMHPLNLNWSEQDIDNDLELFNNVAKRLADEPKYLREMILTRFWRHTLIACVSVILLETKEFCADLSESFRQPNFVSPQIAVTLGLLCPEKAVERFSEILDNADFVPSPENWERDYSIYTDPKAIAAARMVLSKLNSNLAGQLSQSEVFQHHKNHPDGQIGADVAEHHWQFWSNYLKDRSKSTKSNNLYSKFRRFFKFDE